MSDNYQPQSAFEGIVITKLETVEQEVCVLRKKMDKVEGQTSRFRGQASILGAFFGGVVSAIAWFFNKH